MQITEDNRPICAKEGCNKPALSFYADLWLCGDCLAKYIENQTKLKQKMILKE